MFLWAHLGMKTILVPTEQTNGMASTLETAVLVARKFGSYVEGFALQSAVTELLAEAAVGMIPVAAIEHDSLEEAKHARDLFERFMQELRVPRMDGSKGTLSFGWQEDAGEGPYVVGSLGRAFDVTVMGRPSAETTDLHNSALEIQLVRKRASDPDRTAIVATAVRHKHFDSLERQHRTGARHRLCDAVSSARR